MQSRTAGDTRRAFAGIATAVASIQQKNQQIAAAAVQQRGVAEEVAVNVTRIRDGADQSSQAMAATASPAASWPSWVTNSRAWCSAFTSDRRCY